MLVIQIEGNIGSGKSTVIEYIKRNLKTKAKYIIEPVSDWKNIYGYNLLEEYYNNPKENAEIFQFTAFNTMLFKYLISQNLNENIVFTERSFVTSGEIFTKLLHEKNYIRDIAYAVITNCIHLFKNICIKPDVIIYLKADEKKYDISKLLCRINERKRPEEILNITYEYLKKLNDIYDHFMDNYYKDVLKISIPIDISPQNQEQLNQIINFLNNQNNQNKEDFKNFAANLNKKYG